MVEKLHQAMQSKQMDLQAQGMIEQGKNQSTERIKAAELFVDQNRINGDLSIRQSELVVAQQQLGIDQQKVDIEKMKLTIDTHAKDIENQIKTSGMTGELQLKQAQLAIEQQRVGLEKLQLTIDAHTKDIENQFKVSQQQTDTKIAQGEQQLQAQKLENERHKLNAQVLKLAQELEKGQQEIEKAIIEKDDVVTEGAVQKVTNAMTSIGDEIQKIRQQINDGNQVRDIADRVLMGGISTLAASIPQSKKQKSVKFKKGADKKTSSVVIDYHDGSSEEIPVTR